MLEELFERNAITTVTSMFDPFELSAERARAIATGTQRDRYYVAVRGARLIGFSMLRGFDDGFEVPSFGIFVDHESQGLGLGRRLTAWTIEQARRLACPAVRLSLYASNERAFSLYRSLGFIERERQPTLDGGGHAAVKIVMLLNLEDSR
jgi:ribosomal protein S18 acetylase RimI-like enzyme